MTESFEVVAGAGTLAVAGDGLLRLPHAWTDEGVTVSAVFTGAHLLHLAVAACVLNDAYREATTLGVRLDGVRVTARGGFDHRTWRSTGIEYAVELASAVPPERLLDLLDVLDEVAEVPRAVRQGAAVRRVDA